jgi:EF-hand domain pair
MHSHVGAAGGGSPLDMIASLQALTSGLKSSNSLDAGASPFDVATSAGATASTGGSGYGGPSMTPGTMNALFAAQSQTSTSSGSSSLVSQLFSLLDTNGDGSISKSEFDTTLGQTRNTSPADSLFAKLDANGDDSVDPSELASALQTKGMHHHGRHHPGGEASGASSAAAAGNAGGADDLLGAGNTGQTVTNSDGSTTTSYADGSQITMTRPAATSATSGAAANNFLERIIQHQAQLLAASNAGHSVAMSV